MDGGRSDEAGILFTDLESSTAHLRALGEDFPRHLSRHHEILRAAAQAEGGVEVGSEGDSLSLVFPTAVAAARAAVAAQRDLRAHPWPDGPWRVRMCVHAGPVEHSAAGAVGIPLHEAARIRNAAHGGQILLSDVARAAAGPAGGAALDLGLHEIRDIEGPIRLHQLVTADLDETFPPLRTGHRVDVPRPLTAFVPRPGELRSVHDALGRHRLVTVVGVGGAGKTRLAFEAAGTTTIPEVVVVELDPLRSATQLAATVARAVGAGDPDGVDGAIGGRRMLLVLDSCEHLLDAVAPFVQRLLERCPELRVLATSREPLEVAGEAAWSIPPLPGRAAVDLFVGRAPEGAILDEAVLHRVCERLDGHPLAIELAAARLRSLTLDDLDRRLHDQLAVLTGGARHVPRHQTIRAAIDGSHELLDTGEQATFRRLSVFAGGWTLDAAEAVLSQRSDGDPASHLDALVQRSLAQFDPSSGRYRLLEPVRQYAAERLSEAGEHDDAAAAHQAWAVALCDRASRGLYVDQSRWTRVLDAEAGNIGAALDRALSSGAPAAASRIVSSLAWYWFTARRGDGTAWTPAVLERLDELEPLAGARALLAAGIVFCDDVDDRRAVTWLGAAEARFRELRHERGLASTLFWSGRALAGRGRVRRALDAFTEAGELYERQGDDFGAAWCGTWQATLEITMGGDLDAAARRLEAVVDRGRRAGLPHVVAGAIGELSVVALQRKDHDAALHHVDEALQLYQELRDRWQVGIALERRCWILRSSDPVGAAADIAAAIDAFEELRAEPNLARSVAHAAQLLHDAGRTDDAGTLVAAVRGTTDPHYVTGPPILASRAPGAAATDPMDLRTAAGRARDVLAEVFGGLARTSPAPPGA